VSYRLRSNWAALVLPGEAFADRRLIVRLLELFSLAVFAELTSLYSKSAGLLSEIGTAGYSLIPREPMNPLGS
jgi:hypothetical protein